MFLLSDMEAECEILKRRLAVMEKQALGMRGAYECLVEALIKASINVADIDAKVSTLQAERTSLSFDLPPGNWTAQSWKILL